MTEVFQYHAKCNREINRRMLDIVGTAATDPHDIALEGYFFTSLGQILDHIYTSDMNWMREFVALAPHGMDLSPLPSPEPAKGERAFADFAAYRAARGALDEAILEYMGRLDAADLGKTVAKMTRSAGLIERPLWKALAHFYSHQTHHRGQVSDVLDRLGIENNYSNMIFVD